MWADSFDIDHFDLAVVVFLQDFQNFQVIAFDKDVLSGVPVLGLAKVGGKGCGGRCLCCTDCGGFTWPEQAKSLLLRRLVY